MIIEVKRNITGSRSDCRKILNWVASGSGERVTNVMVSTDVKVARIMGFYMWNINNRVNMSQGLRGGENLGGAGRRSLRCHSRRKQISLHMHQTGLTEN